MKTAVAIFGFNRPDHMKGMLDSLQACDEKDKFSFYAFIDGPRNDNEIEKVQSTLKVVKDCEEISFRAINSNLQNRGLANSIISGVTGLFEQGFESVIVLEDDLILSKTFLTYMKIMLESYRYKEQIFSISGYSYPASQMKIPFGYKSDVYFSYRPHSWGWATWKDRWSQAIWSISADAEVFVSPEEKIKFNRGGDDLTHMLYLQLQGQINSWAIRWAYTHYKLEKLAVYPVKSLVENHGFDGSGTHCKLENVAKNLILNPKTEFRLPNEIIINKKLADSFRYVFSPRPTKLSRFKSIVKKLIRK